MRRLKKIQKSEFEVVFAAEWKPVTLEGDAIPSFARNFPGTLRCTFIASGEVQAAAHYPTPLLPDARLVGGIDVWREAPDDPVPYNKDWYAVLESDTDKGSLFLDGPQKDSEHWHDKIPSRYIGARVVGRNDRSEE